MEVDIFVPCFIDQFFPQTAMNMVKILEKLNCKVHYNPDQTCCGQAAYNAGFVKEAKAVAQKFIKEFAATERFVVVPSASCVGMVRNHYELLFKHEFQKQCYSLEKRVFELSEFIVDVLEIEKINGAKLEGTATYHDSCAALRECEIQTAPRKLLENVEGLNLVEMQKNEVCCGFGGTFSVKFQGIASAMAEQKIDLATATQADYLISTDYSCLMHLEGYIRRNQKKIQAIHIADVLASGWE